MATTLVECWYDPACPWCWVTSRWLVDVRAQRAGTADPVILLWRPFSLLWKTGAEMSDKGREKFGLGLATLRVVEAARAAGIELADELHTAVGTRIHHDGERTWEGLVPTFKDAGLDDVLIGAGAGTMFDAAIQAGMDEAMLGAGEDIGIPCIRVGGTCRSTFFGPILSPAPTGADAVRLFDGLVAVIGAAGDAFWELKRHRTSGPSLPERY